jgi:signal recognition particle subunit SRP54
MGDILQLVTEAQQKFSADEAQKLQEKMEKGQFTLDDFMSQMGQVKKLGSMDRILGMIPGMSQLTKQMNMGGQDVERQMNRMTAIYNSMSKVERRKPDLLDGQRRRRIARGAGVELNEVGQFMKQFEQTRDMMKAVGRDGHGRQDEPHEGADEREPGQPRMPGGPMLKARRAGTWRRRTGTRRSGGERWQDTHDQASRTNTRPCRTAAAGHGMT